MKSEYINPDMVEHILYALTPANRLVCQVCLHTGLRVGDVLQLRTADLKQRMTITEQKTGKKRRVCLTASLLRELQQQAGKVYVFEHRTDPGKHRTRQAVYLDLKRAAKAFRLKINLTPHSLRKIYAVCLYQKSCDLKKVQTALNHEYDSVTLLYALADVLPKNKKHP